MIPSHIRFEISLAPALQKTADAVVALFEHAKQAAELAARLNKSTAELAETVTAHPDPDPAT